MNSRESTMMDAAWQHWLHENLAKGCPQEALADILRQHGLNADGLLSDPSPGVDYGRLAQRPFPGQAIRLGSKQLQLYTIENFLDPKECQTLITLMNPSLRPSTLTTPSPDKDFRTSKTSDLTRLNHPDIQAIEWKIANTIGIRLPYAENMQGQYYEIGEQFKAHTDYFEPGTREFSHFGGTQGNRTWTFMVYLNEVTQGGGTHFFAPDVTFLPKTGRAIVWNNLRPDGQVNSNTLHAGLPVEAGYKAIITKWFRERGPGPMFLDT